MTNRHQLSSSSASDISLHGTNDMAISNSRHRHHQSSTSVKCPVAILWDIENCPVPSGVRPEDVAGNIRMALDVHPTIDGAVTSFSAFGDFNAFSKRLREGCQRTGVKLVDVPNGRKDAADKAILVDMFLFALDNPPPSYIMLISGDVDFSHALHIIGQRGYTVILVIPSNPGVSSALCNAGRFVWDWPSVARGEGFVPLSRMSVPCAEIPHFSYGCQVDYNVGVQNEEESILYRGGYSGRDLPVVSHSRLEFSSSSTFMPHNPPTSRSRKNKQRKSSNRHGTERTAMWRNRRPNGSRWNIFRRQNTEDQKSSDTGAPTKDSAAGGVDFRGKKLQDGKSSDTLAPTNDPAACGVAFRGKRRRSGS